MTKQAHYCGVLVAPKGMWNHLRGHLRFEAIKAQNSPDECWPWPHAVHIKRGGYGSSGLLGETYAHRVAYRLWKEPIPNGLQIDHLCRNPLCVNPAHLEAVPQSVNWERGLAVTRLNALRTHCIHGHEFDQNNTYQWRSSRLCRPCNAAAVARYKARKAVAA
jgi:hypothetical protein